MTRTPSRAQASNAACVERRDGSGSHSVTPAAGGATSAQGNSAAKAETKASRRAR